MQKDTFFNFTPQVLTFPDLDGIQSQVSSQKLYEIRQLVSSRTFKLIKSAGKFLRKGDSANHLFEPLHKIKKNPSATIVELWCGPGRSFDTLLEHIWRKFEKIIFMEANGDSIQGFKEKLQSPKYSDVSNKVEFIHTDLWKVEQLKWLEERLWGQSINLVYAKAFIHHLDNTQQESLLKFFWEKLWEDGFMYFYNQFIPDNIEWMKHKLFPSMVLHMMVSLMVDIGLKSGDMSWEWVLAKKDDIEQGIMKITKTDILKGFMSHSIKSSLYWKKKYSEKIFQEVVATYKSLGLNDINAVLEAFFNIYAMHFTSQMNNSENAVYNLQRIWDLQVNMEKAWLQTSTRQNISGFWTGSVIWSK
jgi:hypothetical protein